jgi:hypothetical protein
MSSSDGIARPPGGSRTERERPLVTDRRWPTWLPQAAQKYLDTPSEYGDISQTSTPETKIFSPGFAARDSLPACHAPYNSVDTLELDLANFDHVAHVCAQEW